MAKPWASVSSVIAWPPYLTTTTSPRQLETRESDASKSLVANASEQEREQRDAIGVKGRLAGRPCTAQRAIAATSAATARMTMMQRRVVIIGSLMGRLKRERSQPASVGGGVMAGKPPQGNL